MNEIFKALKDTGVYEVTVNNSIFNNTIGIIVNSIICLLIIVVTFFIFRNKYKEVKNGGYNGCFYRSSNGKIKMKDASLSFCIPGAHLLILIIIDICMGLSLYGWIHFPESMFLKTLTL